MFCFAPFLILSALTRIYQSSKYTEKTAESDVVVVEFVKADKFEVDQTASNGFNLVFGKEANVAIADVTVEKIIKVGDSTGKLPQVVSNVAMSEDKKTASVSLFTNFENGATYEVTVKGYDETVAFVAAIGKPTTMSITSKSNMNGGILVYTNTPTDLVYTLYDEFGNDITNTTNGVGYVIYSVANATSSDYYVSGDSICIYKAGTEVAVNAEYFTGEMSSDGYQITVKTTGYFVGVDKALDSVAEVTLAVKRWGSNTYNGNKIPVSDDNLQLELKIKTTVWQDQLTQYLAGQEVEKLGTETVPAPVVRLRSSNPDILDVRFDTDVVGEDEETGEEITKRVDRVVLFKEGTAAILVDLITWNADGTENVNTIAATYVTVMPKRSIASITANGVVTVGTGTTYNTATMNVTAKDQYGEGRDISSVSYVKLVDTGVDVTSAFTLLPRGTWNDWTNAKLEVSGDILALSGKDFAAGKNEITLYVVAKLVSNEWTVDYGEGEVRFSVIVKRPAGAEVLNVETAGDASGNVARYLNPYDNWNGTEKQKTAEFKVFTMQNGVKVVQEPVAKKLSNVVSGAAVDDLFYTVTHDGVDVTANTYFSGNTVKIDYSGTESKYMAMPSGYGEYHDSVIYKTADNKALGAGNYVFTLYKVVADSTGTRLNYSYVDSASVNVSCDMNGSYTLVKRTSETATHTSNGVTYTYNPGSQYGMYDTANQKALRDCFEINDTNGNKVDINAQTPYFVDAVDTQYYVHVKSITFYECVDSTNGVYAPYTVQVNTSLKK